MPRQSIIPGSYPSGIPYLAGGHRAVNMFMEPGAGPLARAPFAMSGTPGMKEFGDASATAGGQSNRGHVQFADTWYTVIGAFLFSVASDGTHTEIFDGIAGTGPVSFVADGDELIIITKAGFDDFVFDGTDVSQLSGANIQEFRSGAYIDQRGLYVPTNPSVAGRWVYSNTGTLTTVDADNFKNAESEPDALLRIEVIRRSIWLFGANTLEPWYATGDTTVFDRDADGIEPYGLAAHDSVSVLGKFGFFLAVSEQAAPHVRMIAGAQSVQVSTPPIDEIIGSGTYTDAEGLAYERHGHLFFALTLPSIGSNGRTFVFDASLGVNPPIWHERQSGVDIIGSWDARQAAFMHGKTVVGHKNDGKLYELDDDTHTDAGNPRMAMFTVEIASSGEFWNIMDAVIAEMTVGKAAAGASVEPKVILDWSDDGGLTYSDEIMIPMGFSGDYSRIVEEHGLGEFRTRLMRFRVTDSVPRAVTNVFARGRAGRPI